jgi:hypothetical protein
VQLVGNFAQGVNQAAVCSSLDACLLTEEEFALQPSQWKSLCDDPFETSQVYKTFSVNFEHILTSLLQLQGPWDEGDEAWGLGLYTEACDAYLRAAKGVKAAKGWEERHAATVGAVETVMALQQTISLPSVVQVAVAKASADWLRGLADE